MSLSRKLLWSSKYFALDGDYINLVDNCSCEDGTVTFQKPSSGFCPMANMKLAIYLSILYRLSLGCLVWRKRSARCGDVSSTCDWGLP